MSCFQSLFPGPRRLHNAVQAKQKDKQAVGQLEKRLKAEQEARATAEKQLAEEKKRKKLEEARAVALAAASRYVKRTLNGRFGRLDEPGSAVPLLPVPVQRGVHGHAAAAHHRVRNRVQEANDGHQAKGGPDPRAGTESSGKNERLPNIKWPSSDISASNSSTFSFSVSPRSFINIRKMKKTQRC